MLNLIRDVREMSAEVELEYIDIEERYRTLGMYGLQVAEEEHKHANELRGLWLDLVEETKRYGH